MDMIKICHKEYQIDNIIKDNVSIISRKNKKYFLRKVDVKTEEGLAILYATKKLSNSGVKIPKVFAIDKKNGFIVSEYVEGKLVSDFLSSENFDDKLYEQLFQNAFMAKLSKMTLNYSPDKWILSNGTLYYWYPFFINYDKEQDLASKYLKLYFNSKDLAQFLGNLGIFYDKSRIKSEYELNKEMVLITCKYYK